MFSRYIKLKTRFLEENVNFNIKEFSQRIIRMYRKFINIVTQFRHRIKLNLLEVKMSFEKYEAI